MKPDKATLSLRCQDTPTTSCLSRRADPQPILTSLVDPFAGAIFPRWTVETERDDPATADGKNRGRREVDASRTVESAEKSMVYGVVV